MPCNEVPCKFEETVEAYANEQAKKAFLRLKAIQDSPWGVPELEASSVCNYWNQTVDFLLGDRDSPTRFNATPVYSGDGRFGVKTTLEVERLFDKKKKKK